MPGQDAPPPLTALLRAWREGDQQAGQAVIAAVYPELRKLAAHYLRLERRGHTLETAGLVHEAYLRLARGGQVDWQDRTHFFAVAARQMRRVLVDHARRRQAAKNPAGRLRVGLEGLAAGGPAESVDLLAVDQGLARLEAVDARAARVVELRYFAGLLEEEAAQALGVSLATVKRDWTFARAFMLRELGARG